MQISFVANMTGFTVLLRHYGDYSWMTIITTVGLDEENLSSGPYDLQIWPLKFFLMGSSEIWNLYTSSVEHVGISLTKFSWIWEKNLKKYSIIVWRITEIIFII